MIACFRVYNVDRVKDREGEYKNKTIWSFFSNGISSLNNFWGQAMPCKTQFTWNFVIDGHVLCNFLVASIYCLGVWP